MKLDFNSYRIVNIRLVEDGQTSAESSLQQPTTSGRIDKILDDEQRRYDSKGNVNALTNLIQIVRYAYQRKSGNGIILITVIRRSSACTCGQQQRVSFPKHRKASCEADCRLHYWTEQSPQPN